MLKSMTAYGRAMVTHHLGRFEVEIQSLNRRYLEIHCQLPRELSRFEVDVRKLVSQQVNRGNITVRVTANFQGGTPLTVRPNLALVRELKSAFDAVSNEVGGDELSASSFLRLVTREEGLMVYGGGDDDNEAYKEAVRLAVEQALGALVEMKRAEGKALQQDIEQRLSILKRNTAAVASGTSDAAERYRKRLKERLAEVVGMETIENEERVLREVAIYADRIDIAEEVTRCESHLDQMGQVLRADNGEAVGKRLEFLLQELNRECNTIGAKASDASVSQLMVASKTELERIREQIQNVE
ncbi:UPF0701 protein YloC [Chlamydiales bacterium SCGC AG-110-P3]|nr:UPF0701 protein YloC [Chlamydiales bacterium SCGC AG-110-P3]